MTYLMKDPNRDLSDIPITVLVVDDEEGPREALRMILKDRCAILAASTPHEALERLTEQGVDVDIVALDIRLGSQDGIEVLKMIKQVAPDVEVFMITGFPSLETAIQALKHGAYDYILKPFDKEAVRDVVRRGILRQSQSLFERRVYLMNHRLKG